MRRWWCWWWWMVMAARQRCSEWLTSAATVLLLVAPSPPWLGCELVWKRPPKPNPKKKHTHWLCYCCFFFVLLCSSSGTCFRFGTRERKKDLRASERQYWAMGWNVVLVSVWKPASQPWAPATRGAVWSCYEAWKSQTMWKTLQLMACCVFCLSVGACEKKKQEGNKA